MGQFVAREWESRFATDGLSRRQKQSGTYRAYIPDRLAGWSFDFDSALDADVADAEREIARFDAAGTAESLGHTLRVEAVASSEIEGIFVSAKRLLRAEMARGDGKSSEDATAAEVLANVHAMIVAISTPEISVDRMLEVHRTLLAPTSQAAHAGRLRSEQTWIGGTGHGPFAAAFVPPPPEEVPALLEDLCVFCNDDSIPTVAQAAIAHAQFETIHPFVDGNGRTGRALIHMIFKRRELTTRMVLPVSRILAARAEEYVAALASTRYDGLPDILQAPSSANGWVRLFARVCSRAVVGAE